MGTQQVAPPEGSLTERREDWLRVVALRVVQVSAHNEFAQTMNSNNDSMEVEESGAKAERIESPVDLRSSPSSGVPTVIAQPTVERAHLRPFRIEVPSDDPFRYDALDRRRFADSLSKLVQFGSGSGVIAINGGWGSGKTTFVKMWAAEARSKGHVVALLNAWDGDYQGTALKHIAAQMAAELRRQYSNNGYRMWWFRLRLSFSKIRQFLYRMIKPGAGLVAAADGGSLWITLLMAQRLVGSLIAVTKYAEPGAEVLKRVRGYLEAVARSINGSFLTAAQYSNEPRRLIVVVDELDRCRPNYAVQFMESIKHVFEVDYVTFVIAVNMEQLEHTVTGLYGKGFNSQAYLERFFDIRLNLPPGPREAFVVKAVADARLPEHFGKEIPEDPAGTGLSAPKLITFVLCHSSLSLREIQKAIRHLQVMLLFHSSNLGENVLGAVALAVIRAVAPESYSALQTGSRGRPSALRELCSCLGLKTLEESEESQFLMDVIHASCQAVEAEIRDGLRIRRDSPSTSYGGSYSGQYDQSERLRARRGIVDCGVQCDMIEMTARMVDET